MIFESFLLSVNVSCNHSKLAYITLNARTLLILKKYKKDYTLPMVHKNAQSVSDCMS